MISMDIEVSENIIDQLNYIQNAANLPSAKKAFDSIVHSIQKQWQGWAMGGSVDGIEDIRHPSSKLKRSIEIKELGDFHSIVYSNSKHAERIESGMPELDMKTTHPYGLKSRISKKGIPYLIVPFRWGAEKKAAHFNGGVVPDYMANALRKMKATRTLPTTHPEANYRGQAIDRPEYKWGARVTEGMTDNSQMVGLVRMAGKGGYFTFRIISAKSPKNSWIRKEIKPIHVTDTIARNSRDNAEKLLAEGLKNDIQSL